MSMYNLIEYSDIYSKTSGQYYRDEPTLDKNQNIIEFTTNNNFWRAIERSLINYEINIQLKWFEKYILVAGTATNQV